MILALRLNLGTALVMALAAAPTTLLAAQAPASSKAAPAPKAAPSNVDADDDDAEVSEVVITGARAQPGEVIGDIKPEIQLSPADVQSYGVSNISDLIDELAPLTRSAKGDDGPVILLNGRRISSFYEIRDLPTEAILRVDILPEEAALKFGYSADQRVINIVLRRRFRAITAELQGTTPTEGGQLSGEADTDIVRIRGDNRFSLNLNYQQSTALTENERNLVSQSSSQPFDLVGNVLPSLNGTDIDPALSALAGRPVTIAGVPAGVTGRALTLSDFLATAGTGNVSDIRRYRTLSPATKEISSNIVYARTLPWGLSATVNANLNASQSDSMLGLPSFNLLAPQGDPFSPFSQPVNVARYVDGMGALQQDTKTWTAHLGGTVNRNAGKWRLQMTANYDHADTQTVGDSGLDTTLLQTLITADSPTVDPFAVLPLNLLPARPDDKARSISDATNVTFLFNGPIMRIPAGNITTSIRMGDAQSWFDTNSFRRGVSQSADLSRNDLNGQISIDLPIASRKQLFLPAAGELSINLNLAAHQLSDFGALTTIGYGVNWTPITGVSFNVSRTQDEGAPTVQQLGNPLVVTPGARILDFRTGQTVEISRIDGGSPGLTSNHRDVMKIGMTLKPLSKQDFVITASFATTRTRNPIQTLPAATAEIEAAFPDRFIRDASGQLIEVDYRPVNFARQDRQELRWGFNYSRPVGPQPTPRANFQGGQRPRGPRANAPVQAGQAANGQATAPTPGGTQPNAAAAPGDGQPAQDANAAAVRNANRARDGGGPRGGGGGGGGGGGRGGGGRGGGGFGGGQAGAQAGRLQFAIYHTIFFENRLLVRPGGPVLDLLNGSAAGNGGGQSRHQVEAQAGYTRSGLGARISATWKSGTFVKGGALSSSDLDFSSIGTLNLRLFANLGDMPNVVEHRAWLKGSRITLSINNLFDTRVRVRDANGLTPISYQPDYLDPVGRTVKLSLRKLFY